MTLTSSCNVSVFFSFFCIYLSLKLLNCCIWKIFNAVKFSSFLYRQHYHIIHFLNFPLIYFKNDVSYKEDCLGSYFFDEISAAEFNFWKLSLFFWDSLFLLFLSCPFSWWCLLLIFSVICSFLFLKAFWFFPDCVFLFSLFFFLFFLFLLSAWYVFNSKFHSKYLGRAFLSFV